MLCSAVACCCCCAAQLGNETEWYQRDGVVNKTSQRAGDKKEKKKNVPANLLLCSAIVGCCYCAARLLVAVDVRRCCAARRCCSRRRCLCCKMTLLWRDGLVPQVRRRRYWCCKMMLLLFAVADAVVVGVVAALLAGQ